MSNSLQPHGLQSTRLLYPRDFPSKNTGVASHFLLQGIFLIGSNPCLLLGRRILHHWATWEDQLATISSTMQCNLLTATWNWARVMPGSLNIRSTYHVIKWFLNDLGDTITNPWYLVIFSEYLVISYVLLNWFRKKMMKSHPGNGELENVRVRWLCTEHWVTSTEFRFGVLSLVPH